jgi:predicted Zn-dependent protease
MVCNRGKGASGRRAGFLGQGMQAFLERFHAMPQPTLRDSSVQNWRVPSPFPPTRWRELHTRPARDNKP